MKYKLYVVIILYKYTNVFVTYLIKFAVIDPYESIMYDIIGSSMNKFKFDSNQGKLGSSSAPQNLYKRSARV